MTVVRLEHGPELWTQGVHLRADGGRLIARLNPDMTWTVWASASSRATHTSLRRPARAIKLLDSDPQIAEAIDDATRIMQAAWQRAPADPLLRSVLDALL